MSLISQQFFGTIKLDLNGVDAQVAADKVMYLDSTGEVTVGAAMTAANTPFSATGNTVATTVQSAIVELQGDIDTLNAIDIGLTTSAPEDLATSAAVGVSTEAARGDHVHALPDADDIVTTAAGVNYTGSSGASVSTHLSGIDSALGSIAGAEANLIVAAGAPSTEGENGDYYLNKTNGDFYGPKSGGSWPGTTQNVFETLTLTSTVGAAHGTASAGVSTEAARADHVHAHSDADDILTTAAGVNYTGSSGASVSAHLSGIDDALAVLEPYTAEFGTGDWGAGGGGLQYTVAAATHLQGASDLTVAVKSGASGGPYVTAGVNTSVTAAGAVTLTIPTGSAFAGSIVIV